jgi:hypothetical protein
MYDSLPKNNETGTDRAHKLRCHSSVFNTGFLKLPHSAAVQNLHEDPKRCESTIQDARAATDLAPHPHPCALKSIEQFCAQLDLVKTELDLVKGERDHEINARRSLEHEVNRLKKATCSMEKSLATSASVSSLWSVADEKGASEPPPGLNHNPPSAPSG